MNDSTIASGAWKSTPTATAADTGITGDAASAGEKTTGNLGEGLTNSAKSGKSNTGKGRKVADPLPVSDLLNILQGILRDLQEAGLPVSAVNLPVSEGRAPRVAVLMDSVIFDTGKFLSAAHVLPPKGVEGHPDSGGNATVMEGQSV